MLKNVAKTATAENGEGKLLSRFLSENSIIEISKKVCLNCKPILLVIDMYLENYCKKSHYPPPIGKPLTECQQLQQHS